MFKPNWSFVQSRIPSFWVAAPCVPGGRARVMFQDDFGNAVEVPEVQFIASNQNAPH